MSHYLNPMLERAHQRRNFLHSIFLLAGIGGLVALSSVLIWGLTGLIWAGVVIVLIVAISPRIPPETVMRLYRAEHVDIANAGQLGKILNQLKERADLPAVPKLYVIPSMTLNAFATGTPRHAAIGLTEGLLRRLTMREIAGVMAHEISHVRSNDLWIMSLADIMTRLTQIMAYTAVFLAILNVMGLFVGERYVPWLVIALLYLTPTLSSLLQLALSRTREYEADLDAASLTGDPLGLASALRRLERYTGEFWEDLMFPVPGRRVPHPSILRSHPPTEDRVNRLLALDIRSNVPPILVSEEPMTTMVGLGPIQMRPRYRWPGIWF